jgi:hypothetical protein
MKCKDESQASFEALDEFCRYWEPQGKLKWNYKQLAIFPCQIKYFMKGTIKSIETTAHMWHGGKIEVNESEWLNAVDHYLGFSMEWQTYTFTSARARVEGDGPKMIGPYWLEIIPS